MPVRPVKLGTQRNNTPLPDACRKTVLLVLDAVRGAARNQDFSTAWLRRCGIGQPPQAKRLLRFLDVVDEHDRLRQQVIDNRGNLSALREFLINQFGASYEKADVPVEQIATVGQRDAHWSEIRLLVLESGRISSLTPNVQNNVLGCLRALHEVLAYMCDDGWLDDQLHLMRPTTVRTEDATTTGASRPARNGRELADPTDQQLRIPYAYVDGNTLCARLIFDGPMDPKSLQQVGLKIQDLAQNLIPESQHDHQ